MSILDNPFGIKDIKIETSEPQCKGIFFRGSISKCMTSYNGFVERKELRFLKRKSCKGCEQCGWLWDFMNEDILMLDKDDSYIGDIQHGKLYTYNVITSSDWESGLIEID